MFQTIVADITQDNFLRNTHETCSTSSEHEISKRLSGSTTYENNLFPDRARILSSSYLKKKKNK